MYSVSLYFYYLNTIDERNRPFFILIKEVKLIVQVIVLFQGMAQSLTL